MSLSLLATAEEAPERVALVLDSVAHRYRELAALVSGAATALDGAPTDAGAPVAEEEDRAGARPVALVAEPRLQRLVELYALIERGVPVVLLHPRLTAGERAHIVTETGARPFPHRAAAGAGAPTRAAPIDDRRPLAILYTSGSSGRPKGVELGRAAFRAAAAASAAHLGWRDDDRWLLALPFSHVGGLSVLLRCLLARRTVVVPPRRDGDGAAAAIGGFDPAIVARTIERERVTLASLVPTQLERLLDLAPRWFPPPHLRAVLLGGAAATPALLGRAVERGVPVLPSYGLTEACAQVATHPPGAPLEPTGGVGPPLPGVALRIAGGRIEIQSGALLSGYLPPGAHPSPFTADGWLVTGDRGRLDERGRLHILGRVDDMVVTGGENVDPAEVEAAIVDEIIASACVFGVVDEAWGEMVAAALVASGPPPPDAILRARLRARLAPFKRPRRIAYVPALPMTASGKLDRRAAAALARPLLRTLAD